ncbi:type 1 glutamine amidotransferase [uncultured Sphingomonas sp.]|uniref:glutamine amidotransferase-related protein n=1 Tax=uncultured Sphingomonas sp. TaxID=158754 RepID=UPI0035C9CB04
MRIGVLETGSLPVNLAETHGRYDAMVRALLGPGHGYVTFRVVVNEWPTDAASFDAFVITGSSAGVNDGLPWIDELAAFLRTVRGRVKLIGICFGHQIMAQAFGGTVEKAAQGWGLGLHRYELRCRPAWMGDEEIDSVSVIASHQDQVVAAPAGSTVFGTSAFTPNAMIDYGDGAISFQCHPEFGTDFARVLIDANGAADLTVDLKATARRSLAAEGGAAIVRGWIDRFLRS